MEVTWQSDDSYFPAGSHEAAKTNAVREWIRRDRTRNAENAIARKIVHGRIDCGADPCGIS